MTLFYNYAESDRVAMTRLAIAQRRTLSERWTALDENEGRGWSVRAATAAEWLRDSAAVVDLGCGVMTLERHLSRSTRYVPVDVVKRDDRTWVVDLNREPPPTLDAEVAVGLGLLEYIYDVPALIGSLAAHYAVAVFSYNVTDAPGAVPNRLAHGWVNDLSRSELEAIYLRSGYQIKYAASLGERQMLWLLNRN